MRWGLVAVVAVDRARKWSISHNIIFPQHIFPHTLVTSFPSPSDVISCDVIPFSPRALSRREYPAPPLRGSELESSCLPTLVILQFSICILALLRLNCADHLTRQKTFWLLIDFVLRGSVNRLGISFSIFCGKKKMFVRQSHKIKESNLDKSANK